VAHAEEAVAAKECDRCAALVAAHATELATVRRARDDDAAHAKQELDLALAE
jgi:hypothetical protein